MQNAEETAFNDRAGSKGADGGGETSVAALTSRKTRECSSGVTRPMPALARVQIPLLGARSVGFLVESIINLHYGSIT